MSDESTEHRDEATLTGLSTEEQRQCLSTVLRAVGLVVLTKREVAWLTTLLLVAGFCIGMLLR